MLPNNLVCWACQVTRTPCRRLLSTTSTTSELPSIAPKAALNVKHIRQNPDLYSRNSVLRNYIHQEGYPSKIVTLFNEWKNLQQKTRSLRESSNGIRTKLSHSKTFSGLDPQSLADEGSSGKKALLEEARALKERLSEVEVEEDRIQSEINSLASELPNLTSPEASMLNSEPRVLGYINSPPPHFATSDPTWRNHVHLGTEYDLLDFSSAATVSGWGWYYLRNEAALLEQALIQHSIDVAMQHGFSVVAPPSIAYSHIGSACGFRPRDQNGEQQVYSLHQSEKAQAAAKPELSLAGTAEIPFAGLKAKATIAETELPLCVVGPSRCYRAEAGARGLETKGLYRVHEFTKVEMFGWTLPSDSTTLFNTMLLIQKEILSSLGLYCRVLEMPPKDLGASASRKQDIEAWFPSRQQKDGGWGEVTSTSMCTDYQSRRLATRVKMKNGELDYPHTVNGTAMAVPRVLAAIVENGWDEEAGEIKVPEILWPWMHGIKAIGKKRG